MKKAQLEVLGLAMIVLLMSIGILFVIKFVFMTEKSDIRESFTQKQIGQNFLAAMSATSTPCQGASVSDLIEDCGKTYHEITCIESGVQYDSCQYARLVVSTLLQDSLDEWKVKYAFSADDADGDNIVDVPLPPPLITADYALSNYDQGATWQLKSHPISLYPEPGVVILRLKIFTS